MISPEEQRAQGVVSYGENDEIRSEDFMSTKWDAKPDSHSGMPASKQEQLLRFPQAGFNPTDPWVMQVLVYLQENLMNAAIKKCGIAIPKSARAHIVPVVNNHELSVRGSYDVIAFSTRGSSSLASLLSGGDYDGDNVAAIWDENITNYFTNYTDITLARPSPDFETQNFNKSNEVLKDLTASPSSRGHIIEVKLREAILAGATKEKREGLYNLFYRLSVYKNGLSHPETIRLGHMLYGFQKAYLLGGRPIFIAHF
ncbi:RNA-dependent RNA polymerase [Ceratobasidium sp. AG-Ba]|nr:RNA-dependent RNA polymerase [Ceratobasidium sp. AG-Ba]QRV99420.1 RNA-dependent RNA polymerase [Ceratobasidium sp. AG-Ba]QRW13927.1 RNA-dependent RNA polymerase [Ceratobasidium sp. AG-Ba]